MFSHHIGIWPSLIYFCPWDQNLLSHDIYGWLLETKSFAVSIFGLATKTIIFVSLWDSFKTNINLFWDKFFVGLWTKNLGKKLGRMFGICLKTIIYPFRDNKYAHIFGKHIIFEGIVLRPWHTKTLFCDHFLHDFLSDDKLFFGPTTNYFLSQGEFDVPQDIKPWLFDQELFSPNMIAVRSLLNILRVGNFGPTTNARSDKTKLWQEIINFQMSLMIEVFCLTATF